MQNFIKIGENLYTNKKHRFQIKKCENCDSNYYCRLDRIETKKTCNRTCYQQLIEKNNHYKITDYLNNIISGSLLSDGCITKYKRGKNYYWSHSCINEDYIDYINQESGLQMSKFIIPKKDGIILGKKVKQKESFILKSKISTTFTEYRNKWYINGIKKVPYDIILNPIVLLHWYIGDGTINSSKGVTFCTDCFDFESISILIEKLTELDFEPMYLEYKNRIIIPNRRVFEFLNYIGNCPVESFKYKWENKFNSYLGRICLNCGDKFDAYANHQKYCNPRCAIKFSDKNGNKLKLKS